MQRKPNQRKRAKKGLKSMRGQPELYDEKKERCTLSLTPTAVRLLDQHAELVELSRSELVERIGRRLNAKILKHLSLLL